MHRSTYICAQIYIIFCTYLHGSRKIVTGVIGRGNVEDDWDKAGETTLQDFYPYFPTYGI